MQPTNYAHVNQLLNTVLPRQQTILGDKLVGLYLYGSLVMGDFDPDVSDVDLLAALSDDLDENDFEALDRLHYEMVLQDQQWDNRIEIAYLSLRALKTFKTERSNIGIISPGEPFHIIDAGKEWLMNWYMVREKGVTLFGPPPGEIIEPVSKAEFILCIKGYVAGWREWVNDVETRPAQAYAILTMCRALYTCTMGEQVSKKQAASWAAEQLPDWSPLIHNALVWRKTFREPNIDHAATLPETRRFVNAMIDRILS